MVCQWQDSTTSAWCHIEVGEGRGEEAGHSRLSRVAWPTEFAHQVLHAFKLDLTLWSDCICTVIPNIMKYPFTQSCCHGKCDGICATKDVSPG